MEEATIALQAEFSTGVWTDFMPDVLLGRGLGFDYGIKGVGPMDLVASTGTLRLALDNRESNSAAKRGYYTPGHADKRSGWDEGIPVRMKFTYAGLDRYKWLGRVASIEPEAGSFLGGDARVQAVDWMDIASRAKLKQLGIVTSKRVDQILPIILADMPVPPRATSYATGVETFASFFNTDRDEGTTILALLQKAARNEYGLIYLKGGSCPTGLNVDLQMICPYDGGPNSNEGHVGTASGVSYAAGKYGQGVEIAAGDTLTYPNPLSAAGGSLALWWKPSADNTGPTRYLFSEGNLKAYFNATDDQIYFTDGTNTVTTAALTFAADVWQHLVFTWGPAGLQIIRNGVLEPGPEKVLNGGFETAGAWDAANECEDTSTPWGFDSLYSYGSASLANTAGAAHSGSRGLEVSLVDDGAATGVLNMDAVDQKAAFMSFWFNPHGGLANGAFATLMQGEDASQWVFSLDLQRDAGGQLYMGAEARRDTDTVFIGWYPIADAWHHIAYRWGSATAPGANDGYVYVFVDGVLLLSSTALDNDTIGVNLVKYGINWNNNVGTSSFYYDDIKLGQVGDLFGTWVSIVTDGALADETALVHSGSHAAKATAGPTLADYQIAVLAVTPGTTYQSLFWVRGDGTNAGRYALLDATNTVWLVYFASTGIAGTVYTQFQGTVVVPAGCTQLNLYCACPPVNGGFAYFDDVSIKAIVTPYTPPTLGPTLYIGSDTSGGNQCDGLIDDLGIAYYPLTVAQAAAIYASSGDLTTYHATQGILRFDSRHSRGLNLTSIVTLDQTMLDLDVSYDRQYIYNLVKARAFPLKVDAAATTVLYELQVPLSIGAGQSVTLELPYRDPTTAKRISASEVVSPLVADTGFKFGSSQGTANDLNASLGISLTIGGNTTTVTLTNNASVLAWLNVLKLHGKGIYPYDPQTLEARDQASIDKRGELLLQFDLEQIDSATKAETYAAYLKNRYHLPQKLARRVRFLANQSAALMAAALDGEPSSRFTMKESMTAIDSDWFINAVKFDVEAGGLIYCEWIAVPADTAPMWIWNTSLWNTDTWGF